MQIVLSFLLFKNYILLDLRRLPSRADIIFFSCSFFLICRLSVLGKSFSDCHENAFSIMLKAKNCLVMARKAKERRSGSHVFVLMLDIGFYILWGGGVSPQAPLNFCGNLGRLEEPTAGGKFSGLGFQCKFNVPPPPPSG